MDPFHRAFYCPITGQIMKDPVIDNEGNSYEREAIENWIKTENKKSPITRNPLSLKDLKPNRALQESIEAYLKLSSVKAEESKVASSAAPSSWENMADLSLDATSKNGYTMVSIKVPDSDKRIPCDICCVVDTSGSMGEEAVMKDGTGKSEAHGLSQLDIVKHAIKTIICNLQPWDRLSLVSFNSTARVVFDLMDMKKEGQKKAEVALTALTAGGQTNLWDGLFNGLEILRKGATAGRISTIFLLTDGKPNVIPPRGHVGMLQKYKDENKSLPCTVNTFGFGYTLDSSELNNIAAEGLGSYSFIPDSAMIGTVFVHAISNFMTTMATKVSLSLEPLNGAEVKGILGGYQNQTASWGVELQLGSIHYGQNKDIVLGISIPEEIQDMPYLNATLRYEDSKKKPIEYSMGFVHSNVGTSLEIIPSYFRLLFADRVKEAMVEMNSKKNKDAQDIIKKLIDDIKKSSAKNNAFIIELLKDLTDQVTMAFSTEELYNKWGKHYLPSLMGAHLLQQCNNFKDPGVQHYGGKLFRQIRDKVDDTFCGLPPPKPSIKPTPTHNYTPVTNMRAYHNVSNGCFHGDSSVLMANGTIKSVRDIKKNDSVMSIHGIPAKVSCVIKYNCDRNKSQLVEINQGLLITPWHPIRINNKWQFPCNIGTITERYCPAVYNFVLESKHIIIINDIECVTLGHGFEEEIVQHSYFGSQRVINDLQKLEGWNLGFIELTKNSIVRDRKNGLICGMIRYRNQHLITPKIR